MQGLRSHLAQAKKCHLKWQADLHILRVPSHSINDGNATATIEEHPIIDWNVDAPQNPEPVDEPHVQEEHEENQDEDHSKETPSATPRWRDNFPRPAGQVIRRESTAFESLRKAQVDRGNSIWGTFSNEGDWEFALWILKSGTTHAATDELLELKTVSQIFSSSLTILTNA